ncbi:MAG: murein L,D-transpeptidase catalytic domain family protein [Chitinophagaceae bacterium]|nr:murein L,D-transpeptidase catalytic domain family protein [Chitinophagaceae bacterium]
MSGIAKKNLSQLATIALFLMALPVLAFHPKAESTIVNYSLVAADEDSTAENVLTTRDVYNLFGDDLSDLSETVFEYAVNGYEKLKAKGSLQNECILTIIDFSKPSNEERLYVLDMSNYEVLYKSLVAHGRNSGKIYARQFSNKPGSHMSSIGFYLTGETYYGSHGFALRLDGVEYGFNNNARKRAIVIHSSDYVNEDFIDRQGYLGRSFGCPALPKKISESVIKTIKERSCLFIYAPQKDYLQKSKLL